VRPRIVQADGQIGFYWATPEGEPATLPDRVIDDEEPDRLVATHLEALDDALIIAAARFGHLLGGGQLPDADERGDLVVLHRCLDLLMRDYALATEIGGIVPDLRAGKIIGTATLLSIRARYPVGLLGPAPFDGELAEPSMPKHRAGEQVVHDVVVAPPFPFPGDIRPQSPIGAQKPDRLPALAGFGSRAGTQRRAGKPWRADVLE
jgi:hypothetical protein